MLCSPADLANKQVPSELKLVFSLGDQISRDLITLFAMADFRLTVKGVSGLEGLKNLNTEAFNYEVGSKIVLEGIMLLPCLYSEGNSERQVFVGFTDKCILLAEQIKDETKNGKVIFIEDLLAITLAANQKKLQIASVEVGDCNVRREKL